MSKRTSVNTHFLCYGMAFLITCPAFAGTTIGLTESQKKNTTNQWGAVTYNTQVSIDFKGRQREYKTNQVVQLLVRIRNLSTNEEYGVGVHTDFKSSEGMSFLVISPSGKDISPAFRGSNRFSGGIVWVHPGQIDGFCFPLSEICKADEVGIYKIVMKIVRCTPDRRKSFDIRSNPLDLSIIP